MPRRKGAGSSRLLLRTRPDNGDPRAGKMKRILLVLLVSLSFSFLAHETRPVYAVGYVTMKANPSSITFAIGASASTVINITSQGGFSGAVSLSWQAYPYQQVSVSLNTTSVTVPTGGSGFATAT